ncbi:MAG: UDP-3-O-acyl-N-acetylglucosamine deacetylase [Phycisphaeraceae bacterium]|nr:UDP-3-O-acyl-N-acetylglucosamine deacetylase [Phycisphaeraceae bacterium]
MTSHDHLIPRLTLASPATVRGTTLFTAADTAVTLHPAPAGHAMVIRRADLPGAPEFPAIAEHVAPDSRHTVIAADPSAKPAPASACVHTTEHVLSALAGLGITDALIEVRGPEIPIGDGSAAPFVEAILGAGISPARPDDRFAETPRAIVIPRPLSVRDGAAMIEAFPPASTDGAPVLDIEYRLDYGPGSPIPAQQARLRIDHSNPSVSGYGADIAPARTFCLAKEAEAMRAMGLFLHLTPRQMLVIGADGAPIDNSLRFADEPARHKLLDVLGDLALVGAPLVGRIVATRSGHALNHTMSRAILEAVAP